MAKNLKNSVRDKNKIDKLSKFVPDPCANQKLELRKAAGIAGQILVHFGAGFGAQREIDFPGTNAQIFDSPATAATFTNLLMTSIHNNLAKLHWATDPVTRNAVCTTAFRHGQLACQRSGGGALDWDTLYATLQEIKTTFCPGGAGGGVACDF
jgi:hypothetical protein